MADTRARASFLAVPRATEEGKAFSAAHTPRSRVLHARRTPRGGQGSPEQPAFVFATPGTAVGGQKAARSTKKKSAVKGRTPADAWPSPLEGSPMQWSPLDSQDADAPEPAQPRPQQTKPANRAGGSAAEADHIAVELNTRLHLSGLENLPHELQSRLNFAQSQQGTKQSVASPAQRPAQAPPQPHAGHSNPAGVQQVPAAEMEEAAAELASRFQEVHVAPTAEQARSEAVAASLASQLEHLQVASNAQQQQQQPHPSGDTAGPDGQQTVPPAAPAVPTGFVFAAGAANSPVQRQGKAASSVRKSQAGRSIGAQKAGVSFAASSKPLTSGAAQPAVPPHTAAEANPAPVSFLPAQPSAVQPLGGGSQQPNANVPLASQPSFQFSSGPSMANPARQTDLGSGFALSRQKQPQEQQEQQHQEKKQHQEPASLAAAPKQQLQEAQRPADQSATEARAGPRPQPPTAFSFVAGTVVEGRAPSAGGQAPTFVFGSQSAGSSEGGPASFIFGSGQRTAAPDKSGGDQQQHAAPQPFASSGGLAARRVLRKGASSSPASQGSRTGAGTAAQPGTYTDEEKKQQAKEALQKEMSASAFCETFRIQGNEAFKNSKYEEALEHYTKAMKALWPCPNLHPMLAPLYSNRAAALLSLGKPWQALQDCQSGLKCDPKFTRCALRIATCYSRLGDFATAERHLKGMQQAAGNAIMLAEIDNKLKEVVAYRDQVLNVLDLLGHPVSAGTGPPDAASSRRQCRAAGQRAVEGGLAELEMLRAHVPHAEYLQAARAQALMRLGRYTEAKASTEAHVHFDEARVPTAKQPWQYWLEAQCAFHEGEHVKELALLYELAQHTKQAASSGRDAADFGSKQESGPPGLLEAVVPLPSTDQVQAAIASADAAQKLRQHGNELMKQRKFTEAVQKYSEALATPGLSAAFAAILYSNRAAAHQGLQQLAQAVADCCRSKALAPAYAKAHSRLAALLSTLRLHSVAVRSLEAALHIPGLAATDRRDYETRLREARAAAQRKSTGGAGQPQPDHYKLLGLERDCTVEDVRKAYKRLALHLHPDKVVSHCRYTAQLTEVGAVVLPAEEAQGRLQEDAKWLFQCLGEAHDVLQDKSKREDLDFELRMDERYGSSSSSYGDPYFGGFGYYGERHYGPGQRSGASGGGYSPGGSFAERVRRAAQQRQQGKGSRGFSGYGWG